MQTVAITQIDSALAGYDAAAKKAAVVNAMLDDLQKQLRSARAQAQAGEIDALTLANDESEYAGGAQARMQALIQTQQAVGDLEDAMQSPLTLPQPTLDAAANLNSK